MKLKISALILIATLASAYTALNAATDVNGHWAEESIKYSMERGYIAGYGDGTFKPDSPIKRSEFVALTNRSMGFSPRGYAYFPDVGLDDWFYGDVGAAQGEGYISGYPDGTFRPYDVITRETAAVIASNLLHLTPNAEYASYFTDGELLTWSKGAVGAAVKARVLSGYSDGSFVPERPITRAEAVSLINRVAARKLDGSLDTQYGYSDYYSNYVGYDMNYIPEDRLNYQGTNISTTTSIDSAGYYRIYNGNYGPSGDTTESFNGSINYDPLSAGTVKNIYVSGDFVVSSFVDPASELVLDNVQIRGRLIVYGINKVTVRRSEINKIEYRSGGNGYVRAADASAVNDTYVYSSVSLLDDATSARGFRNVIMDESCRDNVTLILSGDYSSVQLNGKKSKLSLRGGTVDTVEITDKSEKCDIEVASGAAVNFMEVMSSCYVHGKGKIVLAKISADGAEFDLKPQTVSGSKNPIYTGTASGGESDATGYGVEIIVTGSSGAAHSGVTVRLGEYGETATDVTGRALFTGVINGTYQCVVLSPSANPLSLSVTVSGGNQTVNVTYDPFERYSAIFTVVKNGAPLAGATVTLDSKTMVTPASGTVVFMFLAPGSYSYTAEYGGDVVSGTVSIANTSAVATIAFP